MQPKFEKVLSSYITTICLLVIYAIGLAVATFIEKYNGTLTAKAMVYYSPWFFLLQFLMVVNFVAVTIRYRLFKKKKVGMILIHGAFIVILIGATISHLFGEEGILHLREGESSNRMIVKTEDATYNHILPFEVELVRFTLTRYPGSLSPSSYESEVLVHVDGKTHQEHIYMNNVLDVKGYRFFQASYDPDEKGTVLSVNKDVSGRNVTYVGYFILLVGFIWCFFEPQSRIRVLIRNLKDMSSTTKIILVFTTLSASSFSVYSQSEKSRILDMVFEYQIDKDHIKRLGATPIQANSGRMMPINTFSSEILRKIYRNTTIKNLNSDEFLLSLLAFPEVWMDVPFIHYSNDELASTFNLTKSNCTYLELFDDNGDYKLQTYLEKAYHKPPVERTAFDKDLMKLDEKANILHQLFNYQLLNLFPKEDEPNHTWFATGDDLSGFVGKDSLFVSRIFPWYVDEVHKSMVSGDWKQPNEILDMIHTYQSAKNKTLDIPAKKIQAELNYNRLDIFKSCRIAYLILGGILLLLSFSSLFKRTKWLKLVSKLLIVSIILVFIYHTYGLGLRWYISEHAPWSNSYETMVYVAWATVLAGLIFISKSRLTFALATLFGGVILFVSGLNWMDPEINPLVPVLKSPWLMFHVAVIVAAYGFFGISCLLGITNQVLMLFPDKKTNNTLLRIRELTTINEISLWIGLMLMTIGTFLGAIWANESWGRYWGWDPKETWALITVVVYAIVLHMRLVKKMDSGWLFNVMSTVSFASVLMTFFGVNYFLTGMHSYGQNDSVNKIFVYLYGVAFVVILLAFFSRKGFDKYFKNKKGN